MKKLIYVGFLCLLFSCNKDKCPEPENPNTPDTSRTNTPDSSKYTITIQPGPEGKDALLVFHSPTQNFPDLTFLHARAWKVDGELSLEKSIIQFDYSAIPSGAKITKATLTFFADTVLNTGSLGHSTLNGPNDWTLKRVTQSWNESTVTWNTEPKTDSISIKCASSTSPFQNYEFDLTKWVKDEVANPNAYYGFLMQINNQQPYRAINFCSSDNQIPTSRPKMVIEYIK